MVIFDIDFVKKEFGEQANYSFESNSEIVDYQILFFEKFFQKNK